MEVVHTDCLPGGILNGTGMWYDAGACILNGSTGNCAADPTQQPGMIPCNRVLILHTLPTGGTDEQLRIYNLNDTTLSAGDGRAIFQARRSIQDTTIRVNRNGDFLLVQHDLAAVQPNTSDWEIVDLCPSSSSFGSGCPPGHQQSERHRLRQRQHL